MKALSVKQPWASLLVAGEKTVECRTWKTSYRGKLLICSSRGDFDIETCILPGGMAIGVIELIDIKPMTKKDLSHAWLPEIWEKDALKGFAWHVKPVGKITPFPVKGRLNIFEVDAPISLLPPDHDDIITRVIESCHREV